MSFYLCASIYLSDRAVLKWLEKPAVYNTATDELYELDEQSFAFLKDAAGGGAACDDREFLSYALAEGLLSEQPRRVTHPPLIPAAHPSLRYLELQITDRCNLRCGHCYIGSGSARELSLKQIGRLLEEFERMQGLRLMITGGEPLLHSGFEALNKMLPAYGFRKVLFSNGICLQDHIPAGLNVEEIQISIDGLEAGHDRLRGEGSFRKALSALGRAREAGYDVSVATMVHAANLDDFDEMERLFTGMGVKDWTVDVPCASGRLQENTGLQVSPEQGGRYLKYGFGSGLHGSSEGYGCGLHLMAVLADGKAAKCTFYADRPAGTIDEGLNTCRQRIEPVALSSISCACEHLESCRGGCRYRAELLGDPKGKDLYRCALYDIID